MTYTDPPGAHYRRRVRGGSTDATVQSVPGIRLSEIIIDRNHRRDLGDIAALANDIRLHGLHNPLVVSPDKVLIMGQRRLEALKLLGWQSAPVVQARDRLDVLEAVQEANRDHTQEMKLKPSEIGRKVQTITMLEGVYRRTRGISSIQQHRQVQYRDMYYAMSKIFDLGHTKLTQINGIVAGVDCKDPVAIEAMERMDLTGKVDSAWRHWRDNRQTLDPVPLKPLPEPKPERALPAEPEVVEDGEAELTPAQRRTKIRELAPQGYTSRQIARMVGYKSGEGVRKIAKELGVSIPADAVISKSRRHDSTKIVSDTVTGLEGTVMALDLVDLHDLDPEHLQYWMRSMRTSLKTLQQFLAQLKELDHE